MTVVLLPALQKLENNVPDAGCPWLSRGAKSVHGAAGEREDARHEEETTRYGRLDNHAGHCLYLSQRGNGLPLALKNRAKDKTDALQVACR